MYRDRRVERGIDGDERKMAILLHRGWRIDLRLTRHCLLLFYREGILVEYLDLLVYHNDHFPTFSSEFQGQAVLSRNVIKGANYRMLQLSTRSSNVP